MISKLKSFLGRLCRNERGATAVIAAFALTTTFGMSAVVVDVANLYQTYRRLQATTDAGAMDINCCSGQPGKALTTATSYSATSGNTNARANETVTMVSGYPALRCFTSTGVSCGGTDNANAIVVKQQATVSLFFAPILGINTATMSASATAGRAGGTAQPADVVLIVDTTASMNSSDSNCSISGEPA